MRGGFSGECQQHALSSLAFRASQTIFQPSTALSNQMQAIQLARSIGSHKMHPQRQCSETNFLFFSCLQSL